ncbi:hypothetical protein ACEQPO_05410 [Bacillus sp. SL00103]
MGKMLYPYARQVFEAEKEVEYQITLLQNGKKGRLRIASTYVPLNFCCLIGWAFKTASPQTEIELKAETPLK